MDLSIRVIAFNTRATKVASHQGTHTYRLSKFLKINATSPKKRQQQQRSGIIQYLQKTVKKKYDSRRILHTSTSTTSTSNFPETKAPGTYQCALLAGCGGRI
jgi:hypothetical protein